MGSGFKSQGVHGQAPVDLAIYWGFLFSTQVQIGARLSPHASFLQDHIGAVAFFKAFARAFLIVLGLCGGPQAGERHLIRYRSGHHYYAVMVHERLRFALERIGSGDWQLFERFCSEFLVSDFPALRTTATPSGDRGRDGELFNVNGVPRTGFQFSVTDNWKSKIRSTMVTLDANDFDYRRVVYCTSQEIGARADDLKAEVWDGYGVLLDVRDREWFCEREASNHERVLASAELCDRVVDPIVTSRGIASAAGSPLSSDEARVALVQLALNTSDRHGDRNLTKTSFDAVVQSALVGTSQETAVSEAEVVDLVRTLVPNGAPNQVKELVQSALIRLSRKHGPVKHLSSAGKYHMSFEAAERWKDSAASYLLDQQSLDEDLTAAAYGYDQRLDSHYDELKSEAQKLRAALEGVMLNSGESFVRAVEGGEPGHLSLDDISSQIEAQGLDLVLHPSQAALAILEVIATPSERTHRHLLRVLDAYTLLAFLHQTPDVQKALSRVFDNAKIWLDTSAVLPLIAETLIDDAGDRGQTALLSAAVASGVSLFVTDGVIEELRFHIERCTAYVTRRGRWEGGLPFLYTAYMLSGRDERAFADWVNNIRGPVDPEHDIEEYLADVFSIARSDLSDVAAEADTALRGAAFELFHRTRSGDPRRSENVIDRLAAHDVDNAVGVMQLRRGSRPALGHEVWWLTLDKTAFKLKRWLDEHLGREAPDTPVLSPDYLSQLLRLGPLRRTIGDDAGKLPLVVDVTRLESAPVELIELARKTRASMNGLDERVIRREVRDALYKMRTSMRAAHNYQEEMSTGVMTALERNSGPFANLM